MLSFFLFTYQFITLFCSFFLYFPFLFSLLLSVPFSVPIFSHYISLSITTNFSCSSSFLFPLCCTYTPVKWKIATVTNYCNLLFALSLQLCQFTFISTFLCLFIFKIPALYIIHLQYTKSISTIYHKFCHLPPQQLGDTCDWQLTSGECPGSPTKQCMQPAPFGMRISLLSC